MSTEESQPPQGRESGQAAVEAALTLPLVIFLVLGTLQLFMMLQGRIMAEYAAFQAVRAGSRNHGNCVPMVHAALAGLLPSVTPYLGGRGSGSAADKLAEAWKARIGNNPRNPDPRYVQGQGMDGKHDGPIFWLVRESPRPSAWNSEEDLNFDSPKGNGSQAMRLEVRLIYWYRLRIPFADWVISRMLLAHLGLKNYDAANPLNPADKAAGWKKSSGTVINLDPLIRSELSSRVGSGQYVYPIQATYGMRMMTPPRKTFFEQQNCATTPEGL
ncbi:TadE/TadG family type IV pilus assembly protein [Vitiosangium sp. GDMCC 1.1324]|uniref:TadE/TadG family type IV pilus assembly protein n=1 Tax=Vitiosangium sp. (strain GDMCC 1.1324) TaxID=2138576 RepID=UPI000D33E69B|nr:TadE family protein [Vitiosangium sp. GDMCC 1.1324]PTL84617.1 pilus assembly protein TadE [Vitiosangium sp. GDMCC 1.1324]